MFQTVIFGSYSSNFRVVHDIFPSAGHPVFFLLRRQKSKSTCSLSTVENFVGRRLHEFLTVLGSCHIEKSLVRDVLVSKETGIPFEHGQAIDSCLINFTSLSNVRWAREARKHLEMYFRGQHPKLWVLLLLAPSSFQASRRSPWDQSDPPSCLPKEAKTKTF